MLIPYLLQRHICDTLKKLFPFPRVFILEIQTFFLWISKILNFEIQRLFFEFQILFFEIQLNANS